MAVSEDRLMEFVYKFVGDLGATMAAGGVVLGDRLGLYRALAAGPLRPQELAGRTGTAPRYVEEWLRGQAARGRAGESPAFPASPTFAVPPIGAESRHISVPDRRDVGSRHRSARRPIRLRTS